MADTTTAPGGSSSADPGAPSINISDLSIWGESLDLATLKTDPKRWDKAWEGVLETGTLSVQEVYTKMCTRKGEDVTLDETFTNILIPDILKLQGIVVHIWGRQRLKEPLVTAWGLLSFAEQERHLRKGFQDATESCLFGQDIRALCPELRTSLLLERAFTDLVDKFVEGKVAFGDATTPYLFPSAWWDNASDITESVLEEFEESSLKLLTLRRNQYIGNLSDYT